MKKGVSRWDVFRFNQENRNKKQIDDFLGTVEALSEKDALATYFAEKQLRTTEERAGIYATPCRY